MVGVDSFLRAIPEAAKSPYSLIAYVVAALLFIVSATKLTQVKKKTTQLILAKIESVNPNQRKHVIDGILGTILPDQLTGDQYLHGQKMRYVFLAFIALLAVIGPIIVIALVISSKAGVKPTGTTTTENPAATSAKVRIQLWPRPEIKKRFLQDNDARLYLKAEDKQIDLKPFVPQEDFLDETADIDPGLIGKAVDLTIGPREKYSIHQNRKYLTQLMRVEVYPLGKGPVPEITSQRTPSGEKIFRTTDLPPVNFGAAEVSVVLDGKHWDSSPVMSHAGKIVSAGCPQIIYVRGSHLSVHTRLDVVDISRTGGKIPANCTERHSSVRSPILLVEPPIG